MTSPEAGATRAAGRHPEGQPGCVQRAQQELLRRLLVTLTFARQQLGLTEEPELLEGDMSDVRVRRRDEQVDDEVTDERQRVEGGCE